MENLFGKPSSPSAVENGASPGDTRRKTRRLTSRSKGLKFKRVYTTPGVDPYDMIEWDRRTSKITNPDGSTVFELKDIEVPKSWTQLATDIVASKYFRKAGVPGAGHETSARQTVTRVARSIRRSAEEQGGYFADVEDADTFEAELTYMLVNQIGAFNSPVWFNCGLAQEYGITGRPVGNWQWNLKAGQVEESPDSYTRPQLSACFIQSVSDDLMDMADLVKREMRIFKFGSGTGTNFSRIRAEGEKLTSGGTSSGLMSFLEIYDKSAGAIKSGGTTRRAAKMVCLDMDHPDIERFVDWKMNEERKAQLLIEHGGLAADFNGEAYHTVSGQNSNNSIRVSDEFMKAVEADGPFETKWRTSGKTARTYRARDLWDKVARAAWSCADPGVQYDSTVNRWHTCPNTDRIHASNPCVTGDALVATPQGEVRIDSLIGRASLIIAGDGRPSRTRGAYKTGTKPVYLLRTAGGRGLRLTADHLVRTIHRGDVPALQLVPGDDLEIFSPAATSLATGILAAMTIPEGVRWERRTDTVESLTPMGVEDVYDLTEPRTSHFVANGIVVHNCSEYMFLDDSACNLASLNLTKFLSPEGRVDVERYRHACEVFLTAQEVVVDFASYPNRTIGQNSHDYRPLGLGYANLGTLLMLLGIPYDSDRGRGIAAALTAIMCGRAYRQSAEIARTKGPFSGYEKNREPALRVMKMHRDAAYAVRPEDCPAYLLKAAKEDWDDVVALGEVYGLRNAQATVLAPTGTIGLLMDCDTTGVEPDFALVKFKKLAGGGYFKIVNESVPEALRRLGYTKEQAREIVEHVTGTNALRSAAPVNDKALAERGLTPEELARVEAQLPRVFELGHAFNAFVLGEEALKRLGLKPEEGILGRLGFTEAEIERSNDVICGRMTIEGAPHLREEHLAIFDCANKCGRHGQRFIHWMGHIRMMGAVQPFISGAISKTINMTAETTVAEIQEAYLQSWKLGLKAVALYRDGCKASQPLSSKIDKKEKKDEGRAELVQGQLLPTTVANPVSPTAAGQGLKRYRLPRKRSGFTQEARVAGQKVYLRTGEYEDGTLGEIFIDMHKEGAAFRSMMNCFAIAVSLGLQYGVPLKEFVDVFTFTRFEPQGMVDHPNIKQATSVVDYILRVLALEYLGITEFAQVKPADGTESRPRQRDTAVLPKPVAAAPAAPPPVQVNGVNVVNPEAGVLSEHLGKMMGDAPFCTLCGHTTVRNGVCYKCLNCGNTLGCS